MKPIDYVLKAFGAMSILSKGIEKAMKDGKVTRMEKMALIDEVFEYLGIVEKEDEGEVPE